jgi:dCTP deaminase
MILCDRSLHLMLPQLIKEPDYSMVNPASVDIRIGAGIMLERPTGFVPWSLDSTAPDRPYYIRPGEFLLVSTYEHLMVPNGYAVELKLKSSRARQGWDHSLAFWFDPGWDGIGTMEIRNITQFQVLPLWRGMRFGQIIVHTLDSLAEKPYDGRYNKATTVEKTKLESTQ